MAREPLIPEQLQLLASFREDLGLFLDLDPERLQLVAQLSSATDGFAPAQKAVVLAKKADIDTDKARRILRVGEYLYGRVSEQRLSVTDAVDELGELARDMGISLSSEQRRGLEEVLAYKREYETGRYATSLTLELGAHFMSLDGSWTIKVGQTRENEVTKVALLGLRIVWHDSLGERREAFLQLIDTDWDELRASVERIHQDRQELERFLGG